MPIEQGFNLANVFRVIGGALSPQAAQFTMQQIQEQERAKRQEADQEAQRKAALQSLLAKSMLEARISGKVQDPADIAKIDSFLANAGVDTSQIPNFKPEDEGLKIAAINPKDFTPESLAAAKASNDVSMLVPVGEAPKTEIRDMGATIGVFKDGQLVNRYPKTPEGMTPAQKANLAKDFTSASAAEFMKTGDMSVLVPRETPEKADNQLVTLIQPETNRVVSLRRGDSRVDTLLGQGYVERSGAGIKLTTPDGTTLQVGGGDSPLALTKPVLGDEQKKIIALDDRLAELKEIESSFKPDFLQLPEQVFQGAARGLDKLGVPLSQETTKRVVAFSQFNQQAIKVVNDTIREVTGAAMSLPEAERIRKQVPDPENDSPIQYRAKLKKIVELSELARARAMNRIKNGLSPKLEEGDKGYESLEDFRDRYKDSFIRNVEKVKQANPGISANEAQQLAAEQTDKEFGIQ